MLSPDLRRTRSAQTHKQLRLTVGVSDPNLCFFFLFQIINFVFYSHFIHSTLLINCDSLTRGFQSEIIPCYFASPFHAGVALIFPQK
jgi:hypothetical protein